MPQLENPTHERVAQIVAYEGTSYTRATEIAGAYQGRFTDRDSLQSYASKIACSPGFKERVAELQRERGIAVVKEARVDSFHIQYELTKNYERCMQAVQIKGRNGKKIEKCECGKDLVVGVYKYDANSALKALELKAKLAGLFVSNVNIRHLRDDGVEGTLEQIWERVAKLAEPLGREFKEWLIQKWGYEVVPRGLRVVEGTASRVEGSGDAAS